MTDQHDHHHDHGTEEHEYITLIDEEGNETLYEIFLTIDGQEEFGKDYVLVFPSGVSEDEEVELQAYAYDQEDGLKGKLYPVETDKEWDMLEEVLNTFTAEEE